MMKERPAQVPAEVVIGISAALLGVILGIGAAYGLWSQLHHTAEPTMLTAAVVALTTGLALVACSVQTFSTRLFLAAAALSLALAFFAGSGAFASLVS